MTTSINMSACLDLENPESALMSAFMKKDIEAFRNALDSRRADPNLVDPKIDMTIFEKVLMSPKSSEFIKACIEHGADLYQKNNRNRCPLHYAIDSLCPENLRSFLAPFKSSEINVKLNHENCLNILAKALMKNYKEQSENIIECMKILLEKGCDPNMPNEKSETPFYNLLRVQERFKNQQKLSDLVKFFMDHSQIDFYTYRGEKLRKMFQDQNPGATIPAKIERKIDIDHLLALLRATNKQQEFKNDFTTFKSNAATDEWNNPKLIYTAVENHVEEIVEFLVVEHNVDINKTFDEKRPPAFYAASSGFHKLLKILLTKSNPKPNTMFKSKSLLHEICHHFGVDGGKNTNVNYNKCFELVMQHCSDVDVNKTDEYNCIPLHYAVRYNNAEAQQTLLERGSYIGTVNIFNETPLDDVNKSVFEDFLDDCVTKKPRNAEKDDEIAVSYKFLKSPDAKRDQIRLPSEMAPLKTIIDNKELRSLILHPVLHSFVHLKWQKLRAVFIFNLMFFAILMISLVAYIVIQQQVIRSGEEDHKAELKHFCYVIACIGILVLIIRESLQLYFSGAVYFRSFVNIIEIALIILAIIVLGFLDPSNTSPTNQIIRVVTIILVSYEMLQLISAVPLFDVSKHMVILKTVAITFLKSILIFSIPLMTFSLCFFILFGSAGDDENKLNATKSENQNSTSICCNKDDDDGDDFNSFNAVGIAFVKTFVMMTGEFDASELKLEKHPFFSITFILYVFFGFMVIFNLLNAFAVEDTHVIKSEGELVDVQQKIEELCKYEKVLGRKNLFLNLLVETIPTSEIIIRFNRKNQCITKQPESELNHVKVEMVKDEDRVALNGANSENQKISMIDKHLPMDRKIIKEFRYLLERKVQSEFEKKKEDALKQHIAAINLRMDELNERVQKLDKIEQKLNEMVEFLKQK